MTRELTVQTEPVPKDHILGLREQFGTAHVGHIQVTYDHAFGFGRTVLACTVEYPDGRRIEETMQLAELLSDWALGIIADNRIKTSTKEQD